MKNNLRYGIRKHKLGAASEQKTTFSEKEKIQLLADIVELQTENNNEIDVCNYLKDLYDKYDIKSEILKVNEHRANIVAESGNGMCPNLFSTSS